MKHHRWLVPVLTAALTACGGEPDVTAQAPDPYRELQLELQNAGPGSVIEIPAGRYALNRGLTLTVDGVTLRGAGMNETVLSFKDQVAGAEGLLVTANDFTIEDIGFEDTPGDALKIAKGRNIVVRRVRTEWTGGPSPENGAYGIYPVPTEHTLIEDSVAIGASDAGIYVGQSRNVVVRRNRAELNVAGIEIENTVGADVYDNVAINNTGGILVFNMPDLPVYGHSTRLFRNRVVENNTPNFAPSGTAVSSVPAGSGIIVNSNDRVEIFENEIGGNQSGNILISSYFSAGYQEREMADVFDPYPEGLYIYDNAFHGGGDRPHRPEWEKLRIGMFGAEGRLPDVLWDGVANPEKRNDPAAAICVDNGDALLLNLDLAGEPATPTTDMSAHRCSHDKLPAVQLPMLAAES
jgi:parallel beta-helix repeat protein